MMLWKVLPSMQIECCDDGPLSNGSKSGYHSALIALYWVSTSENFGYWIISVDSYFYGFLVTFICKCWCLNIINTYKDIWYLGAVAQLVHAFPRMQQLWRRWWETPLPSYSKTSAPSSAGYPSPSAQIGNCHSWFWPWFLFLVHKDTFRWRWWRALAMMRR